MSMHTIIIVLTLLMNYTKASEDSTAYIKKFGFSDFRNIECRDDPESYAEDIEKYCFLPLGHILKNLNPYNRGYHLELQRNLKNLVQFLERIDLNTSHIPFEHFELL